MMDNTGNEIPQGSASHDERYSLTLSDRLLERLRKTAQLGRPLTVFCIVLAVSSALLTVYRMWIFTKWSTGDFYLLEGNNLYNTLEVLVTAVGMYLLARAILQGSKAWRLLKNCENDDQALLEGSECLAQMFRWLTIWGAFLIGVSVAETALRALAF